MDPVNKNFCLAPDIKMYWVPALPMSTYLERLEAKLESANSFRLNLKQK